MVGIATVEILYPGVVGGIGTLFNYGPTAIMITATSQLVSPELMFLVASDVIAHPVSLFQRIKRGFTGAREAGAMAYPNAVAPPLRNNLLLQNYLTVWRYLYNRLIHNPQPYSAMVPRRGG